MKITIESTDDLVSIDGVEARLWNGTTSGGIRCHIYICKIGVHKDESQDEFQRELKEAYAPSEIVCLDI